MKVTIDILRSNVMSRVEGLSVIVAERLAKESAYTYDQLWASASDMPKLDIFYKEAIADLETQLKKYVAQSTHVEEPQGAGGQDYHLTLRTGPWWPSRLEGVLKAKVLEYFVHAVVAGWLSGYAELKSAQDYAQMVLTDVADVKKLILAKALQDLDSVRVSDTAEEGAGDDDPLKAKERVEDDKEVVIKHDSFDLSGTDFGMVAETYK